MTMTMNHTESRIIRGDVQCLNCGRTLGLALKSVAERTTTIRPARPGMDLGVERGVGGGLRCKRCGGRAYVEFDESGGEHSA
jgi:DNA-directed RNA polymerase subunit RPC12/RpoP